MRAAVLVLLAAPALAGCLAPAPGLGPQALPGPAEQALGLLAHTSSGLVEVPGAWQGLRLRLAPTGYPRGEPTLGVTGDGTLFTIAGAALDTPGTPPLPVTTGLPVPGPANRFPSVARSLDHGITWERLWDPLAMGKVDLDPWVWVDPSSDRVFHAPLYVACSWLAWSDDAGASWQGQPLGGCGTPAHDHQKLTSGPPPAGVGTQGFPSVLYYAYNSFRGEGTVAITSLDGGLTWGREQAPHPQDACYGGINGPVAVDAQGRAYLPKPTCDAVRVAVSDDAGARWQQAGEAREGGVSPHSSLNPRVAVDAAGNAYLLWNGADNLQRLSVSRDRGATWGPAMVVSAPGVRATLFGVLVAGAEGRVALAYLGTESDPAAWDERDPSHAPDDTVWHLYLASTLDALAPEPTWVTAQATPEDDPVQRGCIWLHGGGHACRNLRDFMDMTERDGRVYVAYPDGCRACASAAESRALGETVLALVEEGPSLRLGTLAPLAPPAPPAQARKA